MKIATQFITTILTLGTILFLSFNSISQNIGINDNGATPHNSAILDLESSDKGFLITRVDTTDIFSPAFGLMTLAPDDSCLYMYNGETTGKKWISIGGVGHDCSCGSSSTTPESPCADSNTEVVEIINPETGDVWMDRNLGASQVATASDDEDAYGDLYQWGRCSDGHEKRSSQTTTDLSSTDTPGHGDFILADPFPSDWRDPNNDYLWEYPSFINNPCPSGYRIPTVAELDAELQSWNTDDVAGAFGSPLKLTTGGSRKRDDGTFEDIDEEGSYWSSNIIGQHSKALHIRSIGGPSDIYNYRRATGNSVRCIKKY